jgi:hypothetical protein
MQEKKKAIGLTIVITATSESELKSKLRSIVESIDHGSKRGKFTSETANANYHLRELQ